MPSFSSSSSFNFVTNIVDEPTAAAAVLKITDGAVVDVGGGTTGISILKDGKVIYTDDEATGGSHMTMTVAGHYRIPYEEAEVLKTTPEKEKEIFPVIKATVEKMAVISDSKRCDQKGMNRPVNWKVQLLLKHAGKFLKACRAAYHINCRYLIAF